MNPTPARGTPGANTSAHYDGVRPGQQPASAFACAAAAGVTLSEAGRIPCQPQEKEVRHAPPRANAASARMTRGLYHTITPGLDPGTLFRHGAGMRCGCGRKEMTT